MEITLGHAQVLTLFLRELLKHMRSDVDGVIDESFNYYFYFYPLRYNKNMLKFILAYNTIERALAHSKITSKKFELMKADLMMSSNLLMKTSFHNLLQLPPPASSQTFEKVANPCGILKHFCSVFWKFF